MTRVYASCLAVFGVWMVFVATAFTWSSFNAPLVSTWSACALLVPETLIAVLGGLFVWAGIETWTDDES